MNILILRNYATNVELSNSTYNHQELGIARALNKKGNKCDVVYYGGKDKKIVEIPYDNNHSFNAYFMKAKKFLDNSIYSKELYQLIDNYDIVHAGGYDQIESWILAKKIPQKLIIFHGPYFSDFNKGYNKKSKIFDLLLLPRYKKYHTWFDTKSNLSKKYLNDKGLNNVNTIGVGIDLDQLQAKKLIESDFSREIEIEKNKGNKVITYIGKIEPRRNTEFLIECFKAISDTNPNVKLVIVGRGEAEYKEKCFDKIKEYGLEEKVLYKEKLNQELLPKIYNLSDVFLLPTRYEIFGMVLLEAMYFETPVITTFNGGSDMLIKNGESGIIINEFNVDKWKAEIEKILENESYRNIIINNAKEKIEKEFTWDALADKFLDVFNKKINN